MAASVPKLILNTGHTETDYDIEQFSEEESLTTDRAVTAEDIPTINSKSLDDFSINFADIEPPEGNDMDEQTLMDYADQLCLEAGLLVAEEETNGQDEEVING